MSSSILGYCIAREELKRKKKETQEERAENADASRVMCNMLTESMQKNNMECIEIPGLEGRIFLKMDIVRPTPLSVPCDEEVEMRMKGVGEETSNIPIPDIPDRVVRFVVEKMRRGKGEREERKRVRIVPKQVEGKTVELTSTPNEVKQLAQQLVQTKESQKKILSDLRPLVKAEREAEKSILGTLHEPVPVRMQDKDGSINMKVIRCERKGKAGRRAIGVRTFSSMCKEAARFTCVWEPSCFEEVLKKRVVEMVREHHSNRVEEKQFYAKVLKMKGT